MIKKMTPFVVVFFLCADAKPLSWSPALDVRDFQEFDSNILDFNSPENVEFSTMFNTLEQTTESIPLLKKRQETLRTNIQSLIKKKDKQLKSSRELLKEIVKYVANDRTTIPPETVSTTAPPKQSTPVTETTQIYIEEVFHIPTTTEPGATTLSLQTENSTQISKESDKFPVANEVTYELSADSTRQSRQNTGKESDDESDEGKDEKDKDVFDVEVTTAGDDSREGRQESAESSEEEDGGGDGNGGIGGLISAFLGSLSRPDGGVDVDAVAALLGSLSMQKEDGTYDFSGLTETLQSFFGGDEEGGGGSDIGRFLGGLTGAFIKGVAQPPGPKGAGIFTGKLVAEVIPALSGPTSPPEGVTTTKPQHLDSGSYLSGLLGTLFSGSRGGGHTGGRGSKKFTIFKALVSMFTSILTASSSSKH